MTDAAQKMTEREAARVIGRNLRTIRGNATKTDLAAVAGISRMTVAAFEKGTAPTMPSTRVLFRIARALDVSMGEFFAGL